MLYLSNVRIFAKESFGLLHRAYKTNKNSTFSLISCEVQSFESETCVSLAVNHDFKVFIGNETCQILLCEGGEGGSVVLYVLMYFF